MPDEDTLKKPATAKAKAAPAGKIVYNPNLRAWRCINAAGRQVLSVNSLASAQAAYPHFAVVPKE